MTSLFRRTIRLTAAAAVAGLMFVPTADAQEQTLVSDGFHSGGFGAGVVRFSGVNDQFAVFAGGRGGWIINHTFILGAAGYGLANDISVIPDDSGRDIDFGYGGLELTYVYESDLLVHGTLSALIGGGSISRFDLSDGVFVFEPSANVVLNITSYFRIAGGGGYRVVSGVDAFGLTNGDFSMLFGELVLKFGSF